MFDGLSVASSGERVNNRKNESRHVLLTLAQCREENVNYCWARSSHCPKSPRKTPQGLLWSGCSSWGKMRGLYSSGAGWYPWWGFSMRGSLCMNEAGLAWSRCLSIGLDFFPNRLLRHTKSHQVLKNGILHVIIHTKFIAQRYSFNILLYYYYYYEYHDCILFTNKLRVEGLWQRKEVKLIFNSWELRVDKRRLVFNYFLQILLGLFHVHNACAVAWGGEQREHKSIHQDLPLGTADGGESYRSTTAAEGIQLWN